LMWNDPLSRILLLSTSEVGNAYKQNLMVS
jgi:hypothetical protein